MNQSNPDDAYGRDVRNALLQGLSRAGNTPLPLPRKTGAAGEQAGEWKASGAWVRILT